MTTDLSVVTVNLNDAAGLAATATSVCEQDLAGAEWLVLDGGSTDGSLDVIGDYQRNINYWFSGGDGGVYDAMNHGLARARGRYVLFMNAGDRFAGPDVLARLVPCLRGPDAPDLLFGAAVLELPGGRRLQRPARAPSDYLRFGLPACHQATVFRSSLHRRFPYDLTYQVAADYAAVARLLVEGASWRCLDLPLARRRCGRDGLSERRTARRLADAARVQREILDLSGRERALSLAWLLMTHAIYVGVRGRGRGRLLDLVQHGLRRAGRSVPRPVPPTVAVPENGHRAWSRASTSAPTSV